MTALACFRAFMPAFGRVTRLRSALLAALLAASPAMGMPPASATAAEIRIAVPYLAPPPGATDIRLYTEEGFEADIAREIGKQTGLPVRLVPIAEGEAGAALGSGRVDVLVTRLDGQGEDFSSAEILPAGFASGISAAMRSDTSIRRWEDLSGRTVCVAEANRRAQAIARSFGAQIRVERAPARSLMAVRTGECDAAIHDEALLKTLFENTAWTKFSATLPATDIVPLVVVLPRLSTPVLSRIRAAIPGIASRANWDNRQARWARNVAFEAYLDQESPDCH